MNLKSLQIPDTIAETGAWLDDLLVSPDLLQTIIELELLAGDRLTTVLSLEGVLAGSTNTILESGLANASESVVRSLLRQPSLLLELQEQVLMHGDKYWQEKTVQAYGRPDTTKLLAAAGVDSIHSPITTRSAKFWNQKQIVGAIAAMAAGLLVMLSVWQPWGQGSTVASSDWGFAKSGLLASDISEDEMLRQLADASQAWHNRRPDSVEGLEKRLLEFDHGCEALLASNLAQLSAKNRDAVHRACRDCRDDIAVQLAAIKRGGSFSELRTKADAAINKLTHAIQKLS